MAGSSYSEILQLRGTDPASTSCRMNVATRIVGVEIVGLQGWVGYLDSDLGKVVTRYRGYVAPHLRSHPQSSSSTGRNFEVYGILEGRRGIGALE